jgi:hypothetical protein
MKSVLFNATGGASAGRPLAAKAPANLIDGDLVRALVPGPGQFERRRDGSATASNNSDLYRLSDTQSPLPAFAESAAPMPHAMLKASGVFYVTRTCGIGKVAQLGQI